MMAMSKKLDEPSEIEMLLPSWSCDAMSIGYSVSRTLQIPKRSSMSSASLRLSSSVLQRIFGGGTLKSHGPDPGFGSVCRM